jgi:hypothetical protein
MEEALLDRYLSPAEFERARRGSGGQGRLTGSRVVRAVVPIAI